MKSGVRSQESGVRDQDSARRTKSKEQSPKSKVQRTKNEERRTNVGLYPLASLLSLRHLGRLFGRRFRYRLRRRFLCFCDLGSCRFFVPSLTIIGVIHCPDGGGAETRTQTS